MKTRNFLSTFFAILAMAFVMTATAQQQGGGQGQGQRQQGTPEEMAKATVERLTEALSLTEDQQTKIYELTLKTMEERQSANQGGGEGQRPDREAMMKAREEQNEAIKKLLTEEQAKKYDEMQANMRQQQGEGQQGGRPQRPTE